MKRMTFIFIIKIRNSRPRCTPYVELFSLNPLSADHFFHIYTLATKYFFQKFILSQYFYMPANFRQTANIGVLLELGQIPVSIYAKKKAINKLGDRGNI